MPALTLPQPFSALPWLQRVSGFATNLPLAPSAQLRTCHPAPSHQPTTRNPRNQGHYRHGLKDSQGQISRGDLCWFVSAVALHLVIICFENTFRLKALEPQALKQRLLVLRPESPKQTKLTAFTPQPGTRLQASHCSSCYTAHELSKILALPTFRGNLCTGGSYPPWRAWEHRARS